MGTLANNRQSLSRQGSVYSLTLNEVENHLGAPLHSMNLDDLLKNVVVWDVDTSTALYASSDTNLNRQGMNQGPSKKTVDEVWRVIQQEKSIEGRSSDGTLGDMTLEDFLMKAGMVAEDANGRSDKNGSLCFAEAAANPVHWIVQTGLVAGSNPGRKRRVICEDVEDKTVERRQKRMIKNRESAARSRARKQAYTNELENKISRLEEENEILRKEKDLDSLLVSAAPPQEPKQQLLRRSISASF